MIPYLILLVMEGSQLLKNKQNRLRVGLNIVGVTHVQFYMSELITYFFSVLVISLSFCLWGLVLDIKYFSEGILWFNFLTIFINGLVVGLIPFCVTAAVSNKNLGMSILYGFVLYSIIMQWLFTGGIILELLYMNTANFVVKLLKGLFNLYPSFHFSKIFSDVSRVVDQHLDTYENRYIEGRPYEYSDLFARKSQEYSVPTPHSYTLPSPIESFFYMILTSLLFIGVLVILDRYVESNRGYTQPFCKKLKKRKNSTYGDIEEEL